MVGLHIYNNIEGFDSSFDPTATLLMEEWHEKKEYYHNGTISINCSFYKGYPVNQYNDNDVIVIYEGMIYNRSCDEVIGFCRSIAGGVADVPVMEDQINKFVESSDGDFIILIYNKLKGRYILFNDWIGRLPFYYYFDARRFIAGRSFPFIIHNIPGISIDKNALTEFIMMEFLLGENTLFKNVFRLSPAGIIFIDPSRGDLKIIKQKDKEERFTHGTPYSNKEEAIEALYQEFVKSTENRIRKLKSLGYSLYSTLSGGFDSRAVFGMINSLTQDFTNVTFAYVQDESGISKQLLERTSSESGYIKLTFDNQANFMDSPLIFRTGNSVNIYTASISYNDNLFMKREVLKNKDAVFGGFGGEYIRHPYIAFPVSPFFFLCHLYSGIPLRALLPVLNVSLSEYRKFMMSTLKHYTGKSNEYIYKHLYNEYYRNYVVGAGEDRMRMFFWTAQPLMASSFLRIIREKIPLKWSNFQFFTDFLSRIDPRLLDIHIFGMNVDLHDRKSIKKIASYHHQPVFAIVSSLFIKYGRHFFRKVFNDNTSNTDFDKFDKFYQKLDFYKDFLNYNYIKKEFKRWSLPVKRRIISVAMFLYELEKHYANKLMK